MQQEATATPTYHACPASVPFVLNRSMLNNLSCLAMEQAPLVVWNKSLELGVTLRKAAYAVACERILEAHRERGWYPEVQLS